MNYSFRLGRLAGTDIKLHWSMVLVPLYFWLTASSHSLARAGLILLLVVLLFGSILLHELGHMVAARRYGIGVSSIVLWPLGGFAVLRQQPQQPIHDLVIAAAGPLVNLALAAVAFGVAVVSGLVIPSELVPPLLDAYVRGVRYVMISGNLALALFNLIPAYPLDGGRIAHAGLTMLAGPRWAGRIMLVLSWILAGGIVVYGLRQGDTLLALTGVLVFLFAGTLNERVQAGINQGYGRIFERGYWHLTNGRYAEAIAYYDDLIQRKPQHSRAYHNRGAAYAQQRDFVRALADYNRVIELAPHNAKAFADRATVYSYQQQYVQALADWDHAHSLGLNTDWLHASRGMHAICLGDLTHALTDYNAVLTLSPDAPFGYAGRGLVYTRLGKYDLAHHDLDRSLQLRPDDVHTLLYRSQLNYAVHNLQQAQVDAERALQLDARAALLTSELYVRVLMDGQTAWIQWFFACAEHWGADDLLVREGRADAYRINGQYAEAIADYDYVLLSKPDAGTYLSRAWAWQQAGNTEQAVADFAQALALAKPDQLLVFQPAEAGLQALAVERAKVPQVVAAP